MNSTDRNGLESRDMDSKSEDCEFKSGKELICLAIQNCWQQYSFKLTDIVYKCLNYNYFQEGSLK